MFAQNGIKVFFIDSIQDIDDRFYLDSDKHSSIDEDDQVKRHTRFLKKLCTELGITIVIGSHLNRDHKKKKGDKRPKLHHLKWSNSLAYAADRVYLLYRPYYYGITVDWEDGSTENKFDIIIAKNRIGRVGTVVIGFDQLRCKFFDRNKYPV